MESSTLDGFILSNEASFRLLSAFSIFAIIFIWEVISPYRATQLSKSYRWFNNVGLMIFNTLLTRLLFPTAAVGIAIWAGQKQWGLFNLIEIPFWIVLPLSVIILDFFIWLQHRLFHSVPLLWKLHRTHHTDTEIDLSTGLRFHPIEIILSMLIKSILIILFGASATAVILFEIILNGTSMFNHGNIHLPHRIDRFLRLFLVTPDMHRIHHSWHPKETNSNFGFSLSIWDKVFGTYRVKSKDNPLTMAIGIKEFREKRDARLDKLLAQPFLRS